MSKLKDKVAIVTGASKGIGAAIAKALAAEGASVVVNYASSGSGADAVVAAITENGGTAVAVHGDVSKAADAQGIVDPAIKLTAISTSSLTTPAFTSLPRLRASPRITSIRYSTSTCSGCFTTQAAAKHLGEGASIINISSVVKASPRSTWLFTLEPKAHDAIASIIAASLAQKEIRVNALSPGFVVTEGTHSAGVVGSDFEKEAIARAPLGRAGQPDDIASAAVFFASDNWRGSPASGFS